MAVLPNNMNQLDEKDWRGSFAEIENYIRYMQENIEHAMSQINKRLSELEKSIEALKKEI